MCGIGAWHAKLIALIGDHSRPPNILTWVMCAWHMLAEADEAPTRVQKCASFLQVRLSNVTVHKWPTKLGGAPYAWLWPLPCA